ncbi:hypothetical protein BKA69DRAFT_769858 [Paraphysoderma sedebokerense]|nr:hypothetical protein BKA69DRAFT_769858 [Paraphysoderma sedebokerense]
MTSIPRPPPTTPVIQTLPLDTTYIFRSNMETCDPRRITWNTIRDSPAPAGAGPNSLCLFGQPISRITPRSPKYDSYAFLLITLENVLRIDGISNNSCRMTSSSDDHRDTATNLSTSVCLLRRMACKKQRTLSITLDGPEQKAGDSTFPLKKNKVGMKSTGITRKAKYLHCIVNFKLILC